MSKAARAEKMETCGMKRKIDALLDEGSGSDQLLTIHSLDDDLMGNIFKFVGEGHYLFLSNADSFFRKTYRKFLENSMQHVLPFATSVNSVSESLGRTVFAWNVWRDDVLFQKTIVRAVAQKGNLSLLQWIIGTGRCHANYIPDCDISNYAAMGGQLHVLQWAKRNGCIDWNTEYLNCAAENGHLQVVQFLRANNCAWNRGTSARAARGGQLEILQWARRNGCPWDWRTTAWAAQNGHLEMLQWVQRLSLIHISEPTRPY